MWFIAGGSHNSVADRAAGPADPGRDPLNDARTQAVIAHVKGLVARQADPHRRSTATSTSTTPAALRAAVAEGATIVTRPTTCAFFERAFAQDSRIRPDAMAGAGRNPSFLAVPDKLEIGDSTRSVEVHRIVGGPHSDSFLMVYLPRKSS